MGKAQASIEITASSSRLAAGLAQARQKFQNFASNVARGIGGAFKSINAKLEPGKTTKHAMGNMLGDLGSKGVGAILDTANSVRDFERNLVRYQIASSGSAASTAKLRDQIREVSRATGVADAEILAGASSYVALTGDAKGAKDAMSAFARISQASGSSVAEVASATAALKQSLGIDGSQVEAAFSGLITQGKAGAVEIKDFAGELATLAPQFATFGKSGLDGLRDMGAAFQVIRQGAGTAGEAATQFQAVMGELVSSHKELKAIGIDVFQKNPKTGKKELRDFMSIAGDISKNKALADPAKMAKIFGRKESQAAIRTIRDQIGTMRDLAKQGEDTGAVQRDLSTFLTSDAGRLDQAFNNVKVAIAEAFTPERIEAFTNAVVALAEKIGPVVEGVGKIAEHLGSVFDVGKSVRGFLSGNENSNPWGSDPMQESNDRLIAEGDGAWLMTPKGPVKRDSAAGRGHVTAAKLRLQNRAGYEGAVGNILGAEKNERSSKESIDQAIIALRSSNIGEQEAGSRYLKKAGFGGVGDTLDEAKVNKAVENNMKALAGELVKALQANAAPTLQIGDNQVARSADQATLPRRG